MKIGYACLTVGVENTKMRTCVAKNATPGNLYHIISQNLDSLFEMLRYNVKSNIMLFRISSDLIPFGSSDINKLEWKQIFKSRFFDIGQFIKLNKLRVSMHPGQYTVLNSNNENIVQRAIEDLRYHCDILDLMELDCTHKIVLHIGGAYDEKNEAVKRFIDNFNMLDECIRKRLIVENDDKIFNISEVLQIANQLDMPAVYDNLHNYANPYDVLITDRQWIEKCSLTWKSYDGLQKIHYSQQDKSKKTGSHSNTIYIEEFLAFYNTLENSDVDIMLEVKDKNLSAMKCMNTVTKKKSIKKLEDEWARYKYTVLEKSQKQYEHIRSMLKDKSSYPALEFYTTLEDTIYMAESIPSSINALAHVWGYFKDEASEKERESYNKLLNDYKDKKVKLTRLKSFLYKLTYKYNQDYLMKSYYFHI